MNQSTMISKASRFAEYTIQRRRIGAGRLLGYGRVHCAAYKRPNRILLENRFSSPPSASVLPSSCAALAGGLRDAESGNNCRYQHRRAEKRASSSSSPFWKSTAAMAACAGLGAVLISAGYSSERHGRRRSPRLGAAAACEAPAAAIGGEHNEEESSESSSVKSDVNESPAPSFVARKEDENGTEREKDDSKGEDGSMMLAASAIIPAPLEGALPHRGPRFGGLAGDLDDEHFSSLEEDTLSNLTLVNQEYDEEGLNTLAAGVAHATNESHNFKVLAAMESRDELQKVQLARLLQELHSLAKESSFFSSAATSSPASTSLKSSSQLDSSSNDSGSRETTSSPHSSSEEILHFCPETDMTPARTARHVESLRNGGHFDRKSLSFILNASQHILHREPSLVDLRGRTGDGRADSGRVTVVGDLHGSIQCLTDVLELVSDDLDEGSAVIFNGDFVDRGDYSLEVILTLLLLKLSRPDQVYLCRGNHEDSFLSSVYGFEDELRAKYPCDNTEDFDALWGTLSNLFSALPLCVRTDTAVVMHGGLPHDNFDLSEVERVTVEQRCRVRSTLEPKSDVDRLLQGLLWSDPCPDIEGVEPNEGRGAGQLFGPDVARRFLDRHGLRYVIRSHEVTEQGWEVMDCGGGEGDGDADEGRYVLTVFSSAGYPNGQGFNKGAVLRLDDATGRVEPVQFSRTNQLPNGHLTEKALNSVVEMIAGNKALLSEAFRETCSSRADGAPATTAVTKEQWASVMASTLSLPDLDWIALQPSLAPTTLCNKSCSRQTSVSTDHDADTAPGLQDTGLIDWRRFLELHSVALSSSTGGIDGTECDDCESGDIDALYANHAMLLTVFKFLDADGNGRIDPEEFRAGVAMINGRLPENRRLKDPDKLFGVLDLDGNGEIELDEFSEVFKVI